MAKVGNIKLYLEIEIDELREGETIPFSLHFHLPLNDRVVCLKRRNSLIEPGFIQKFKLKNFTSLLIQEMDEEVLKEYLVNADAAAVNSDTANAGAELSNADGFNASAQDLLTTSLDILGKRSENSEDLLHLPKVDVPELDKQIVTDEAQLPTLTPEVTLPLSSVYEPEPQPAAGVNAEIDLSVEQASRLKQALQGMSAPNAQIRGKSLKELKSLAKEVILADERPSSVFSQLWQEVVDAEEAGHCGNVATFSVLFSMALGHRDREILKDVAFAGLVHDIGLTQLDRNVVLAPSKENASPALQDHVSQTLFLLTQLAITPPPRSVTFILQHHEKFDGTGYPKKVKNWDIQELSQSLSMADIFDDMFHGGFDGKERTITEAFRDLMILEKSKIFPQHYNPDLFVRLVQWIQNQTQELVLDEALNIIEESLAGTIVKQFNPEKKAA